MIEIPKICKICSKHLTNEYAILLTTYQWRMFSSWLQTNHRFHVVVSDYIEN